MRALTALRVRRLYCASMAGLTTGPITAAYFMSKLAGVALSESLYHELAAREGCRTIALPSISTGIYGYPVDLAARVALDSVAAWVAERPETLDTITFVLYSADTLDAFERARRS